MTFQIQVPFLVLALISAFVILNCWQSSDQMKAYWFVWIWNWSIKHSNVRSNVNRQGVFSRQFDLTTDFEQRVRISLVLVIVNIIIQFRKGDTRRRSSARPRRTQRDDQHWSREEVWEDIQYIEKSRDTKLGTVRDLNKRHYTGTILICDLFYGFW